MKQHSNHIAMLRPAAFGFNTQTASNNAFMQSGAAPEHLQALALQEFDNMVAVLQKHGVDVLVLPDTGEPVKPDAIFLNNWFCCRGGQIQLFPMWAQNRRTEKRPELIAQLSAHTGINRVVDWSHYELKNIFLEGTGSMVTDYINSIAFACLSERTSPLLFEEYCHQHLLKPVVFTATDANGMPIYHTNVMMAIGEKLAIICTDAIASKVEKKRVLNELQNTGHQIIEIGFEQMNCFAGNMLELINRQGERLLIMSLSAFNSLTPGKIAQIEQYNTIVAIAVPHIEKTAGGSVRCMMAELYY